MPTRRTLLGSCTALLGALAGCGQSDSASPTQTGTTETTSETDDPPRTETTGETDDTPVTELDLREANVTEVSIDDRGDGQYRFSVTLYHDDDGEDGYANWWQVERLDGEQLGRRELLHAHSTDPFTRSQTIAIPSDVDCVVVRGHDQTHGYGGQAMTVSVPDGATNAVRQGSDRSAISATDCH